VTCVDGKGRELSFRDITGDDLEYLDMLFDEDEQPVRNDKVIELLTYLCTGENVSMARLTHYTIHQLFIELKTHILCNYMTKETWLGQCYSIQNGSFQNLAFMESVPMSKFVAMCKIHKEAMDQINNNDKTTEFIDKV